MNHNDVSIRTDIVDKEGQVFFIRAQLVSRTLLHAITVPLAFIINALLVLFNFIYHANIIMLPCAILRDHAS